MVGMEFEMTPGKPNVTVNRNLALISLHPDFTYYLGQLEQKTRPIELPVMQLTTTYNGQGYPSSFDKKIYLLKEDAESKIQNFAETFESKYPEVEQVYVFSVYSWGFPPFRNLHLQHVPERMNNALEKIILKKYLIIDYPTPYCNGYLEVGYRPTNPIERQKIISKSLRFNSW